MLNICNDCLLFPRLSAFLLLIGHFVSSTAQEQDDVQVPIVILDGVTHYIKQFYKPHHEEHQVEESNHTKEEELALWAQVKVFVHVERVVSFLRRDEENSTIYRDNLGGQ